MKRATTVVVAVLIVLLMSLGHCAVAAAQLRLRRTRPARCAVGRCFDVDRRVCTGQPCGPAAPCAAHQLCDVRARLCPCEAPGATVQTPGAQCASATCDGRCVVSVPCTSPPCPALFPRPGRCTSTAGNCECVPLSPPTPRPTPTPPCTGMPCDGPCTICQPCPPGAVCPAFPCLTGTCQQDTLGSCVCAPSIPPTPTPRATPTPACENAPCGGACAICPPCFPGTICPAAPCRLGTCVDSANAGCTCVPNVPPSPTPAPTCATDADCNDDDGCTADHCVGGSCEHVCVCTTAAGEPSCCGGPTGLCVRACAADSAGTCGGACPGGGKCEMLPGAQAACGCVSGAGGPCGGNIFAPPPVCAPGLVCQQSLPDATGVCVAPNCIPLFASGCLQTSDCCEPCGNGTRPPCAVCLNGTCVGAP